MRMCYTYLSVCPFFGREGGGCVGLYESGENYLETILILKRENGFVRAVDVAEALGFSKPSVSRAIGLLKDGGYLLVGKDGELCFTPAGEERAKGVLLRHGLLRDFLTRVLQVDEAIADQDACRVEHVLSQQTIDRISAFMDALAQKEGRQSNG